MNPAYGYVFLSDPPASRYAMNLDFGTATVQTTKYGATTWNAVAQGALADWNQVGIGPQQDHNFFTVQTPAVSGNACTHDGVNEVAFSATLCGLSFGSALAVTQSWTVNDKRVEEDVIFNSTRSWDAYSGPLQAGKVDFYRVALHEFGHVVGLDHPDEWGQTKQALMNSIISNLDTIQQDDIDGAHLVNWNWFNFQTQYGVALNTPVTSNSITVTGITSSATISVTGGQYSINGGAYTGVAGTVSNGQTVTLRVTSSSAAMTATTATLNIGAGSGDFSAITAGSGAPITANTSSYSPLGDGNSKTYRKDGVDGYTETVLAGTTLINGVATKAIQDSDGKISYATNDANGIREHRAYDPNFFLPGIGNAALTMTFSPPVLNAPASATLGQVVNSSGTLNYAIPLVGINSNLTYSTNSTLEAFETITVPAGTFNTIRVQSTVNVSGTVNGQTVNQAATGTQWVASGIGMVKEVIASGNINTYLLTGSNLPYFNTISAISFSPATLAVGGTTTASATATSGLAVSFSSAIPSVCTVSGSTVTGVTAGTCTIAADQAGNASYNAATQVTQSIIVLGTVPNAFNFPAQTGVVPNALVTSAPVTVSGINTATAISVVGGEYSVNYGIFTALPGTVVNGDTVVVRQKSANGFSMSQDTTLTIGGVSATFNVTTMPPYVGNGTVLYIASQPGDYIGGGNTWLMDANNQYAFTLYPNQPNQAVYFSVIQPGYTNWWYLHFVSPTGQLLKGIYPNAQRWPFQTAGNPGLDFSGNGRGCNTLTGQFEVLEAVYDLAGQMLNFAANFEQHCEGGAPALFGQIRYNSSVPIDFGLKWVRSDFNLDGKADIFWRDQTTGQNALWFMNGAAVSSTAYTDPAGTNWTAVGISDFNGDGKADILWRDQTSGQNVVWFMNGATLSSYAYISTAGSDWNVAGTGDFDGDGKQNDILWFNTVTRETVVWLTNNGQLSSYGYVYGAVPAGWTIAGVGDFDGDGKSDILWRNTNGTNVIWFMNGVNLLSTAVIDSAPGIWSIKGVADFDGDGKADIFWQDTSGSTYVWLMNGATTKGLAPSTFVGTAWTALQFADFDGDGKADILWRNAAGETTVWLMNGLALPTSTPSMAAPLNWTAIQATPNTTVVAVPAVSLDTTSLTFAARNIGNPSAAQAVTLTNSGGATLNIASIVASGDFASTTCTATLAAGANCTINVTFTATAMGARTGTVTITSDATGSPHTVSLTGTGTATRSDFNGDGKADILWRDQTTGNNILWFMNGATVSGYAYTTPAATNWTAVGVSDFNGDGKADILWRNQTSGQNALWFMNGATLSNYAFTTSVSSAWVVAGIGSFNGRWLTNNGQLSFYGYAYGAVPAGWTIAGVGDFDGDGKSDILWRNTVNGANVIWFMNGANLLSTAAIASAPAIWSIKGVADFDGDGKADIFWQDTAGNTYVWLMNGATTKGLAPSTFAGTIWTALQFADFDGDGKADILWRNAAGETTVWLMNGLTLPTSTPSMSAPLNWTAIRK